MKAIRSALTLGGGLALQGLLAFGALHGLFPGARVVLAFATLVLLPGLAPVAAGLRPPGDALMAPAWALGFGVAWNALLLLATIAIGVPFTQILPWTPVLTSALWLVAFFFSRAPGARAVGLSRGAAIAVLLAAALAAIHVARLGTPLMINTDSPDHVGTIRRMLWSERLFPEDAFFRDAGPAGADPRKGLWHGQIALIAKLAVADPVSAWRDLSACLAPLFVLTAASLGFLVRGNVGAAPAGWALLLTYGGGLGVTSLREAVYATKLADQLSLATAVAALADLARPSRGSRLAAVALGFAAVTTHVFASLQFALVFPALAIGLVVRDRGLTAPVRRWFGTALAIALVCAPYVVWRAGQAGAPVNPIHTEPQGLLTLVAHARVVSIGVLWEWLGLLWVVVPLAWLPLWRRGRQNPAVLYLLTTSLAVALVMFDPLAVGWLEPKLGYLLMRMIWIIPLAGVLAWVLPELGAALRSGSGGARARAGLALAGILVLTAPKLGAAVEALARPDQTARAELADSPLGWRPMLRWMDTHLPSGQVVLSDPGTSYAVPMMTRDYVVTLLDQHSSPSDPLALTRVLDARRALDPYGAWVDTRDVVHRYGVDLVLLNGTFADPPGFDYWAPGPDWYRAARARLDAAPAAFERLAERDGLVLYRVHQEALDTLATRPVSRPFVAPFEPGRFPIAQRTDEGRPVLHRLRLVPGVAAPGDTLDVEADWRALEPQPPGAYRVAVRFDRALPGGFAPPSLVRKPARKLLEHWFRERYRFRSDHLPVEGRYSVDAWRPDEVVRDSFRVIVPRDAAEGRYEVRIKMLRQPHYANFSLGDYFVDQDYYAGVLAGRLEVRRSRKAAPLTPEEAAAEGGH